MKGLLIKDLTILKNQKMFLLILLVFAVFFGKDNPMAGVSYITFMAIMFAGNSIAYDEYDNGYAFLMTLPFARNIYVRSKYILTMLILGIAWFVSMAVATAAQIQKTPQADLIEVVGMGSVILCMALILVSIIIPIRLKFGQNKASISIVIIAGTVAVLAYFIYKCIEIFEVDVTPVLELATSLSVIGLAAAVIAITCVIFMVSYCVSCRIMNKKEF